MSNPAVIPNSQPQHSMTIASAPSSQPVRKTAFVHKLYTMLHDPSISHLIWWSRANDPNIFALHPGSDFSHVLTLYFKHGNVSSFVRQLHMYGFHKVFDSEEPIFYTNNQNSVQIIDKKDDIIWEFKHSSGYFKKDDDSKLSMIKRRSSNRTNSEDTYETHYQAVYSNHFQPVHSHHQQQVYVPHQHQHQHQQLQQQQQLQLQQQQQQHHQHKHPMHVPTHSPSPFQQISQSSMPTVSSPHNSPHIIPHQVPPYPVSYPYPQSIAPPNEPPHFHPIYHEIQTNTDSLQNLQTATNIKSQYLASEINSAIENTVKIGETLPKIAPILQKVQSHPQYMEEMKQVEQSFSNRANDLYSLQQTHAIEEESRKSSEVQFWKHTTNTRQPSVFVDPLNASGPNPQPSAPVALNARPFKFGPQRSNNSLPGLARSRSSTSSPTVGASRSTSLQQRELPRSIPSDYDISRDNSLPNINPLTSQFRPSILEMYNIPRSSTPSSSSSSSIAGAAPNGNPYNSLSSASTHSGFSAHSSMSSMSSRNSQSGIPSAYFSSSFDSPKNSISSLATNSRTLYLNRAQTPPLQTGSISGHSVNSSPSYAEEKERERGFYRPSLATISDNQSCSSKSSGSNGSDDAKDVCKLKVSSLLSEDNGDSEEQQRIKRARV